ncbi:MAG: hypothetical protein AAF982_11465 [Pseudomonadota bacterium]
MSRLLRWFKRLAIMLGLLIVSLLAPVAYVEIMCRGETVADDHVPLLPPEHHRNEARTFLTYPEWHIVHAYDDYAKVIATHDPHHFAYLASITRFWTSLCALSARSARHGGFTGETKSMVYVIGVSFNLEMIAKAAYEETVGRLFAVLRGPERVPLDDLSARQAADYAVFLRQTPWYKWDFDADTDALRAQGTKAPRDRERRFALGVEYRFKAMYARAIAAMVATVGADETTLRMIVTDLDPDDLSGFDGIAVLAERPQGVEIETPRYRRLTGLLADLARRGGNFVEIAGNDDILLTALSEEPTIEGVLHSFPRQGYGDVRHLIAVKVEDLAETLRGLEARNLRLEHIHDY